LQHELDILLQEESLKLRICSFLPSATEIVYALGLQDQLFGVTHECDYPEDAKTKPKLTASLLSASSSGEIDRSVRESLRKGNGIYSLNYENLRNARPDIIFTQELCEVCAVPYGEIERAAKTLAKQPQVVSLDTFTLEDILKAIEVVGAKCGETSEGKNLVQSLRSRIRRVEELSFHRSRKKVFFMEWIEPIMSCGHWMPELIDLAGGSEIFGVRGKNSRVIDWKDVAPASPEYLIIAPCGFGVKKSEEEARKYLPKLEGWESIPAVKAGNVYLSDGNAYFSRPGPRIVDGLEILASILNPEAHEYSNRYGENDYKPFIR
jgi:iron complex transport system substrate-binding protein